MIKRRFQVFVSSTFEDLREERQAAVEAILKAGHIPAGMELFTAGSESQLAVIRNWIQDSDIYLLILGARYGSIEPKSQLSYTEVEFDYALELGKPFFSVVLSKPGEDAKVKLHGSKILERENVPKYDAFRSKVSSRMCSFFESTKDIKLAIFETLPQIALSDGLAGWVPASDVGPSNEVAGELARALEVNRALTTKIEQLERKVKDTNPPNPNFERLHELLSNQLVDLPASFNNTGEELKVPLLELATFYASDLSVGVSNSLNSNEIEKFLRFSVAPPLVSYGLAENDKVPARVQWRRLKLSKEGVKFLTWVRLNQDKAALEASPGSASDVPVGHPSLQATSTSKGPKNSLKRATRKPE
jgi:hypothetical protein